MYYLIGGLYNGTVKKLAIDENNIYYFTDDLFSALRFNDEESCIDYIEQNITYQRFKHLEKRDFKTNNNIFILRIKDIKYERYAKLIPKKEDELE